MGKRKRNWRILTRHKWIVGATVTESVNADDTLRRYTATVRGYRNWRIYEGAGELGVIDLIIRAVRAVCDQIDAHGEDAVALVADNQYSHTAIKLEAKAEMLERSSLDKPRNGR